MGFPGEWDWPNPLQDSCLENSTDRRAWQATVHGVVERSDRMWSTGEGNGKPLQCSCLENPMNSNEKAK